MPLERFIPFRKHDVSRLCENVIVQERTLFRTFSTLLVNRIHYQYHEQLEGLKDSYNDFDPNKDTRDLTPSSEATSFSIVLAQLAQLIPSILRETVSILSLFDTFNAKTKLNQIISNLHI